jgi:RNA polymerase sigma-70 factor (ECF subfamily)
MSADEQQVIVLGYFEGLTSSEIAERLGTPVGTVKSRTRSALIKLRGALAELTGAGKP